MIWSDRDIKDGILSKRISVSGFSEQMIQPASLDLTLGSTFWRFMNSNYIHPVIIDPMKSSEMIAVIPDIEGRVRLDPQCFILGSTAEQISLGDDVVARVEGKSSLGRLGLSVHCTAGFIDPGNKDLNITLELFNQSPLSIILYVGMWICQLSFHDMKSRAVNPYGPHRNSRYFADNTTQPSRVSENLFPKLT